MRKSKLLFLVLLISACGSLPSAQCSGKVASRSHSATAIAPI